MYCNKFFKTEDEAKAFQKSHGGALYKNVKRSHTRESYRVDPPGGSGRGGSRNGCAGRLDARY